MTREDLKDWEVSEYNERTPDQLDYYVSLNDLKIGSVAYLYSHRENDFTKLKILHVIRRSEDIEYYDNLDGDVLLLGEDEFNADTSAEFITNDDCYLVWFKYEEV